MSAGAALQAALASALGASGELSVFDGAPPRAAYPYAAIDCGSETDWSHKSGEGREVGAAITLWHDQPAALHALADMVENAAATMGQPDGWQLVSLRLVRRRLVRDVAGPWAAAIDYRARLLKI